MSLLEHSQLEMSSYPILSSQKTTLSIISYHFTIFLTSRLLFSNTTLPLSHEKKKKKELSLSVLPHLSVSPHWCLFLWTTIHLKPNQQLATTQTQPATKTSQHAIISMSPRLHTYSINPQPRSTQTKQTHTNLDQPTP